MPRLAQALSLVFFAFLFVGSVDGQNPKAYLPQPAPFLIEEQAEIDLFLPAIPGTANASRETLEQQNIKPQMMPVRRIPEGSASLCYALATCLEYYTNLNKNYKVNLSPDFIWLNLKKQPDQVSTAEAMQFLVETGTISAAILPYGSTQLTSACFATPRFTIAKYLWMFREFTASRQKVYETRKALIRGNPVLIQLRASTNLASLGAGKMVEAKSKGDQIFPMVIVGFDEKRQAFELMSFWGKDWGNSGYSWISYDQFGKWVENGFVLVPAVL